MPRLCTPRVRPSSRDDDLALGYSLSYWRTATGEEVDFVLYGDRGLVAFEVKIA